MLEFLEITRQEEPVNRVSTAFAVAALIASGVAAAQGMQSQQTAPPAGSTPPAEYPSSSSPSSSSSSSSSMTSRDTSSSSDRAAMRQQMKDCMAQQKASNPGMSRHDMKKYCKGQISDSSSPSPHQ
jgi:hypothetical protein